MSKRSAPGPSKYWIPIKNTRYRKPDWQNIKEYRIYHNGNLHKVMNKDAKFLIAWMVEDIKNKEVSFREYRIIQVDECSDGTLREVVLI